MVLVGVTLLEGDVGVVLVCNGLGAALRRELEQVCECPSREVAQYWREVYVAYLLRVSKTGEALFCE